MKPRDWRIVGATLLTAWLFYCLCVIWHATAQPITDPMWMQISVAYPFVFYLMFCGAYSLAEIWKWAVRP